MELCLKELTFTQAMASIAGPMYVMEVEECPWLSRNVCMSSKAIMASLKVVILGTGRDSD